jgi:hypothetical protein
MTQETLYPHLKRARQILPNGWHTVTLNSISEHRDIKTGEDSLKLEFVATDGYINLLLPISKETVFLLNRLSGVIGITAEKYSLSDLVNATLLIQIKYKRVIKIKKP